MTTVQLTHCQSRSRSSQVYRDEIYMHLVRRQRIPDHSPSLYIAALFKAPESVNGRKEFESPSREFSQALI